MLGERFVRLLVKDVDMAFLVDLLFSIVGLSETFQQTPFAMIVVPPSLLISPPEIAVVVVILVTSFVVKTAVVGFFLQE